MLRSIQALAHYRRTKRFGGHRSQSMSPSPCYPRLGTELWYP